MAIGRKESSTPDIVRLKIEQHIARAIDSLSQIKMLIEMGGPLDEPSLAKLRELMALTQEVFRRARAIPDTGGEHKEETAKSLLSRVKDRVVRTLLEKAIERTQEFIPISLMQGYFRYIGEEYSPSRDLRIRTGLLYLKNNEPKKYHKLTTMLKETGLGGYWKLLAIAVLDRWRNRYPIKTNVAKAWEMYQAWIKRDIGYIQNELLEQNPELAKRLGTLIAESVYNPEAYTKITEIIRIVYNEAPQSLETLIDDRKLAQIEKILKTTEKTTETEQKEAVPIEA